MIDISVVSGCRYPFAFVVFSGRRTRWWMWFLKQGFAHCFLILGNGYEWILIDPLANMTELVMFRDVPILTVLRRNGCQLVRTTPRMPTDGQMSFRLHTCVEVVSRFLGLEKRFLLTPYQLFRLLTKE